MENLLVSIVIAMCSGDNKDYKLRDETVSCMDYYVNCILNGDKAGVWTQKDLDWCSNNRGVK